MSLLSLALRSLAMTAWAVWVGGFTFYGAVVLWVVHEAFGGFEAGLITQRVTDWLNTIGVGTVALWWLVAYLERRSTPTPARLARLALLGMTTILLAFLIVDHRILDDRLEVHGLSGFYAYHRVYLVASTAQWAINLLILPPTLRLWRDEASAGSRTRREREGRGDRAGDALPMEPELTAGRNEGG